LYPAIVFKTPPPEICISLILNFGIRERKPRPKNNIKRREK
jgi:hypothetical protein